MIKWFKERSILEKIAYITTLIGIAIIFWFLVQLISVGVINPNNSISIDSAAKIGDFIGGFIGVFFTLVGVFLLFENLSMQRKNLLESKALLQLQSFEGTLFNLLNAQNEITNQIEYSFKLGDYEVEANARKFFVIVQEDFKRIYDLLVSKNFIHIGDSESRLMQRIFKDEIEKAELFDEEETGKINYVVIKLDKLKKEGKLDNELSLLKESYLIIFNYYHHLYGHYFRHLYHILKFIKDTEGRTKDFGHLKSYADLVHAQMSSSELLILFLNGLCFKEMKKLIHYYNFLENLAVEDLLKPEHQELYAACKIDGIDYPKVAFKSRLDLVH